MLRTGKADTHLTSVNIGWNELSVVTRKKQLHQRRQRCTFFHVKRHYGFNLKLASAMFWRWGFWFRMFGHGVRVLNRNQNPEVFSSKPELRVGPWSIKRLKP